MKQVLIQRGAAIVKDVPSPGLDPGEILVRVQVSCLSVGTEMSGVRSSATPLWKKGLQQPEKLISTINLVKTIGLQRTWSLIEEKRDASQPTGYSAAGIVEAVGVQVKDFSVGDYVACAGNQYAYHSEFIRVPENLSVLIPEGVSFEDASTVTLGAIALQGVRRAGPTLGECFVVVGLGLLGQLTIQLLSANGCRTIGVDLNPDRIQKAKDLGMEIGLNPDQVEDFEQVARLTDGFGADGVIITAATPSDSVVSTAFKMCRKKGRVVLVGDVGLNLNRSDFYAKEIDFFISSSYGPGRYDTRYEEQGLDYPIGYVRWTENRNMKEYLRLVAENKVKLQTLVSGTYSIEEAPLAYQSLKSSPGSSMMVLLKYTSENILINNTINLRHKSPSSKGIIRVAVLGAGSFAKSSHLPNIKSLSDKFILQAVVTRSGHSASAIAAQFGASYATTSYDEVLHDPDVDAVIISTRHHLHGSMALEALKAGKHVLVEKPLALSPGEINDLDAFINSEPGKSPILLTGYNRRFSPYAHKMAKIIEDRSGPFIINYRMNAGYIPADHWVHGPEGGGRNIGEACHIYDFFTYLTGSKVTGIAAQAIKPTGSHYGRNDNFVTTLNFSDGSLATLTYTALGTKEYFKESVEVYTDGKIIVMQDFKQLETFGTHNAKTFKTSIQEKGLKEELTAFANAINGGEWPIPWWQQKQTAEVGFTVEHLLS